MGYECPVCHRDLVMNVGSTDCSGCGKEYRDCECDSID